MLKVVGIVGSPRSEGNTEFMVRTTLDKISENGIETELITLHDKNIQYCSGCDGCKKTNKCVIDDDMQELTEKVKELVQSYGVKKLSEIDPEKFPEVLAAAKALE